MGDGAQARSVRRWTPRTAACAVLPKEKIDALLTETSQAVGGLGPALQRLVDSTTNIAQGFRDNLPQVNDIIAHSAPILDSQVDSGDNIEQWARNLNIIAAQSAEQDAALRSGLQQAAPTLDQTATVFSDVRDALPQTLANLAVVIDMLKRYHKGPRADVGDPAAGRGDGAGGHALRKPRPAAAGAVDQPAAAVPDRVPARLGVAVAGRHQHASAAADGHLLQDSEGLPGQRVVRGARNYPCVDVPGKRAATPRSAAATSRTCRWAPNPWYGDPNQVLSLPGARGALRPGCQPRRCVIPAPTVNSGVNPAPADQLPPPRESSAPVSDPLSPPGRGTVQCSGQQPNPCTYTPAPGPPGSTAIYSPTSGEVVGPDGVRYNVSNSSNPGDDGWKEMLAPAG